MVLIKEIELELTNKNYNVPEAVEDTLIKDSVLDLANTDFSKVDDFEDIAAGDIRKRLDVDPGYSGKPISRKSYSKGDFKGENFKNFTSFENEQNGDDSDVSSEVGTEDEQLFGDSDEESENGTDLEGEDDIESDSIDAETEDDVDISSCQQTSVTDKETLNIFSDRTKDVDAEVAKGTAVKNQLNIWESLLEGRIKLQNSLISVNKLYQKDDFVNFKNSLKKEDETVLTNAFNSLGSLMKTLLELQEELLSSSADHAEERPKSCNDCLKNEEMNDSENESISSSLASGFNEEEEKETKQNSNSNIGKSTNNDLVCDEPKSKKMKLEVQKDHLEEIYTNFKPYRDKIIQMWNDRTRITSGKISNSDFSAFDQPTLKQIEQILLDKMRLIRKTQLKRSGYEILGKRQANDEVQQENEDVKDERIQKEYDSEIFDDDDFYHKLLRDFIERKATDVTDSKKHNRQWFDIQQLRSKMKRKIDTRCTKGRKLRFTVHNKLVNFMAPIPCNKWSDEAQTQLFKSLFGKANELQS